MKKIKLINLVAVIFTSSLLLSACGSSSNTVDEASEDTTTVDSNVTTDDSSVVSDDNSSVSQDTITSAKLSAAEIQGLLYMREEEELARDLYLDIYVATGSRLNVFKNISDNAETQHAEAMRVLLETYGLEDPSTGEHNTYTNTDLQALYDTLLNIAIGSDDLATLRVGALVEETDIRDILSDKAQVASEHKDIIDTYNNLLCGSRNHLRAFVKQIENKTGSTYVTQVPELDAEVQAILNSDQEKCGN